MDKPLLEPHSHYSMKIVDFSEQMIEEELGDLSFVAVTIRCL